MLFHSTLRQELARSLAATVLVLLTIVMTMMLIRTLGMASQGNVNPSEVGLVLGYTMLGHLPTLLTMSLFMSMVWTFSRMFRDSEMIIWLSSGRSLLSFLRPMLQFAWPILILVLSMTVWVWPWSNQQIQQLKDRFEQRGDLERVSPGEFQESANGQRVFFIDKNARQGRPKRVRGSQHAHRTNRDIGANRTHRHPQRRTLSPADGWPAAGNSP